MTQAALLELQGIETYYGPVQVHFGVDLVVPRGEIVCLLGGNASGKSTTMKVILGLVTPRAGRVLLEGDNITALPTPHIVRRGIASVPESRRIFGQMSVRENLLMGAYTRRDRAAIADDLERVLALFPRLGEQLEQRGATLSGGEQQMLAMARALMSRPRLICMDEPTMGLSPRFVEIVLDLIADINRSGVTVLMVEQNANLALEIAHRAYVLQTGRIVLGGAAAEVRDNPMIQDAYLGRTQAA